MDAADDGIERDEVPALAQGYVRIAVLLAGAQNLTPGRLAQATGLDVDELGPVLVLGDQALVDVRAEHAVRAREALRQIGPTQVVGKAPIRHDWTWLRLEVGRNHGMTMGQLGKILDRAGVTPAGRIKIQNTHTLIGIRDDKVAQALSSFAQARLNGVAARPSLPPAGTIRESPAYTPKRRE